MDGVQHVAGYELPEKNGRAFMSCICCVAVEVQPPSPSTSNSSNKCFTSTTTSITHEMELINIILEGVHSSEEWAKDEATKKWRKRSIVASVEDDFSDSGPTEKRHKNTLVSGYTALSLA